MCIEFAVCRGIIDSVIDIGVEGWDTQAKDDEQGRRWVKFILVLQPQSCAAVFERAPRSNVTREGR